MEGEVKGNFSDQQPHCSPSLQPQQAHISSSNPSHVYTEMERNRAGASSKRQQNTSPRFSFDPFESYRIQIIQVLHKQTSQG